MTAKQIIRHDVNTADVRLNEVITGDNGQIIALVSGQPEYVDVGTVTPFASVAEAQAGTATDVAVTPAGLPLRVEGNALIRQDGYGGNARGDGAVDLQRDRDAAAQVASGDNAVIGGGSSNRVSGELSTVPGGANLILTGYGSFATGAPASAVTLSADNASYTYAQRSFLSAPATAPTDADLVEAGSITFYLDETANALKFRVRYSDGTTLKTGTVSLV